MFTRERVRAASGGQNKHRYCCKKGQEFNIGNLVMKPRYVLKNFVIFFITFCCCCCSCCFKSVTKQDVSLATWSQRKVTTLWLHYRRKKNFQTDEITSARERRIKACDHMPVSLNKIWGKLYKIEIHFWIELSILKQWSVLHSILNNKYVYCVSFFISNLL